MKNTSAEHGQKWASEKNLPVQIAGFNGACMVVQQDSKMLTQLEQFDSSIELVYKRINQKGVD